MKKFKILAASLSSLAIVTPMFGLTSCGGENIDTTAKKLAESTIEEFKEFTKHPHPSHHLDEIRSYLTNKIISLGYEVMRDNYGNIWFDIPATGGNENLPRLILQAHFDMVMSGIPEEEFPYTGVELETTTDADGRPIMQAKNRATSIGADDGIGVALILAIAKNKSISHGPLRAVLTADEETGLFGATNLSSTVIDTDYLLNIDGEGDKQHEYIVTRGCGGLCEYFYNKTYATVGATTTPYQIQIAGFAGGHYNEDENIIYTADGEIKRGNADRFLMEVLYKIAQAGGLPQLYEFNHKGDVGDEDEKYDPRYLATHAKVQFSSTLSETDINQIIKEVYFKFREDYKGDDWDKIKLPEVKKLDSDAFDTNGVMNIQDTHDLVELFATIPISVEEWEGDSKEKMIEYNYPTKSSNFSSLTINSVSSGSNKTKSFHVGTRGVSGTNKASTELTYQFTNKFKSVFAKDEITCTKDYGPWDAGDKVKMIELVTEAFHDNDIDPYINRTRGGVEPAAFVKKRPTLQQVCIGPRIDGIHLPGETLYLDTIAPVCRVALYVMKNLEKITK